MTECLDLLRDGTICSTSGVNSGHWQVKHFKGDRLKTAFASSNGLFQFFSTPFELKPHWAHFIGQWMSFCTQSSAVHVSLFGWQYNNFKNFAGSYQTREIRLDATSRRLRHNQIEKVRNPPQHDQSRRPPHSSWTTRLFTTHHRRDSQLEALNELYRTMTVPRLSQRFSKFCTQLRVYCSTAEQKIAKDHQTHFEICGWRATHPTNILTETNQASILVSPMIYSYLHFGHQHL